METDFQFFLNNREIIKNLSLNTGTSQSPKFTPMCMYFAMQFKEVLSQV